MYGPSDWEWFRGLLLLGLIAAAVGIGVEHGVLWLSTHLSVGWK